jgi:hypothetical protein
MAGSAKEVSLQGPNCYVAPHKEFSSMLKKLLQMLRHDSCLQTAFNKCSLVPLNREKVLERLPSIQE